MAFIRGGNARQLLELNIDRLFLIDPYLEYKRHSQEELDPIKTAMLSYVLRDPQGWRVNFILQHSIVAAKLFDDLYFDYVYIDGDHSLEAVMNDMVAWFPKVRDGGVLAGHDYRGDVKKAVDEYCSLHGKFIQTWDIDGDWLIIKR